MDEDKNIASSPSKEERHLEAILFGSGKPSTPTGYVEEKVGEYDDLVTSDEEESDGNESEEEDEKELQPAWFDEDDENLTVDIAKKNRLRKLRKRVDEEQISGREYKERLREQYKKLHRANFEWEDVRHVREKLKEAKRQTNDEESDNEDSFDFKSSSSVISKQNLRSQILSIRQVRDANVAEKSQSSIRSVQFHPHGQVVLVGSADKMFRLFRVDNENNPVIASVLLKKFPLTQAKFFPDGKEILVCGNLPFFYSYDVVSGKTTKSSGMMGRKDKLSKFVISPSGEEIVFLGRNGYLSITSRRTKQWVADLKMNYRVNSAAFSQDGNILYATGEEGEVYIWDLRTRRCLHRFSDDGCVHGTSVAVSSDGKYISCGSDSGVVNTYDAPNVLNSRNPTPLKTFMNLTTDIDNLMFNCDSQLLALSSRKKKDSIRLVHLETMSVYMNWPTSRRPMKYVTDLDFSPRSGYLAVGNDHGRVMMYRLNHFKNI